MGNSKISLTGEFVAIMKSDRNSLYSYFVSEKAKRIYNIVKWCFPQNSLNKIFKKRLWLSKVFENKIKNKRFKQFVDVGAGFSLNGFEKSLKNSKIIYVDIDFKETINYKRKIIKKICKDCKIMFPKNYYLVAIDVLEEDISFKLKNILNKEKVLIISEGVSSYFDLEEFDKFIDNIFEFLKKYPNSEFFSHESIKTKKTFVYRIIRLLVSLITKSKSNLKFEKKENLEKYLQNKDFKYKVIQKKEQLFYSIKD